MQRSWFSLARVAAPMALAALAACGSDSSTGVTGGLTGVQRTKLNATFARPDVMNAIASTGNQFVSLGMAEGATLGLNSVGTINFTTASPDRMVRASKIVLTPSYATIAGPTGTYKAFGAQLVVSDSSSESVDHSIWTGFVAVDDLDNPTTLLVAGVFNLDATSITSIPATTFESVYSDRFAAATYIKLTGATTSTVYSTVGSPGGSITISSASFSGSTGCGGNIPVFIPVCTYGSGTMVGSFGFTATQVDGVDTVTIPTTSLDIPASQTTIVFDESLFPTL